MRSFFDRIRDCTGTGGMNDLESRYLLNRVMPNEFGNKAHENLLFEVRKAMRDLPDWNKQDDNKLFLFNDKKKLVSIWRLPFLF